MRKTIDPEKLRDMVRSILPSTHRKQARIAKALRKRAFRRRLREDVRKENPEETKADFLRDCYVRDIVIGRQSDKLNHFFRWCDARTKGMTKQESLDYVRGILPRNLIGDHAYQHWEWRWRYPRSMYVERWEAQRRAEQEEHDSAISRLYRALRADPTLHGRLNAEIKSRRKPDAPPPRLLRGIHDVEAFVEDIHPHCLMRLLDKIEKGGLEAALRISALKPDRCAFVNRSCDAGSSFSQLPLLPVACCRLAISNDLPMTGFFALRSWAIPSRTGPATRAAAVSPGGWMRRSRGSASIRYRPRISASTARERRSS